MILCQHLNNLSVLGNMKLTSYSFIKAIIKKDEGLRSRYPYLKLHFNKILYFIKKVEVVVKYLVWGRLLQQNVRISIKYQISISS